jgi:hypothetical protein
MPQIQKGLSAFMTKSILNVYKLGQFLGLLVVCSCASTLESPSTLRPGNLPADVTMNQNAGRGRLIIVPIRLETGEELPFVLDTGASGTCFDKSLEPTLGTRLDTGTSWHFGHKLDAGEYAAPKLYCGHSLLLMTGPIIVTHDLKQLIPGHRVMGILGMDVLAHYCIQLDFAANKLRFLDDQHASTNGWGQPFSMTDSGSGCFRINENLGGGNGPGSLIDTGCLDDGWLTPALFQRWTNQATLATNSQVRAPIGKLRGECYPEVELQGLEVKQLESGDSHMKFNGIGLPFLSRHLVTLDFPKRTLYLKRVSVGPLQVKYTRGMIAVGKSGYRFIKRLHKNGQLPGWSKGDRFATNRANFRYDYDAFDSGTLDFLKKGDSSIYCYTFGRESKSAPWKLHKAWRADQKGLILQEYTLP